MRPQCQAWMPNGTRCKSPGRRDDKVNAYVCEKHQGKRGLKFARLGQWVKP